MTFYRFTFMVRWIELSRRTQFLFGWYFVREIRFQWVWKYVLLQRHCRFIHDALLKNISRDFACEARSQVPKSRRFGVALRSTHLFLFFATRHPESLALIFGVSGGGRHWGAIRTFCLAPFVRVTNGPAWMGWSLDIHLALSIWGSEFIRRYDFNNLWMGSSSQMRFHIQWIMKAAIQGVGQGFFDVHTTSQRSSSFSHWLISVWVRTQ